MLTLKTTTLCLVALCLLHDAWAETLASKAFYSTTPGELLLTLEAEARGSNWGERGREAPVARLFVDGVHRADAVFFAGSETHVYRIMLGRVPAGAHLCELRLAPELSAPSSPAPWIKSMRIETIPKTDPAFVPLAHAPLVYARPDTIGRFSDIPLVMWFEAKPQERNTVLRYSVVFSDEDGGTEISARMARWGRASDIEWIYEVSLDPSGKILSESFQGPEHQSTAFRGEREASHPLLLDVTTNNNVWDQGSSQLLFAPAPFPFELPDRSRERVMDKEPWTYRIMAEEVGREGKVAVDPGIGQGRIADPRQYIYLEAVGEPRDAAVSFDAKLRGESRWFSSDFGIGYFRINRAGYFQTAIRLPAGGDPRSLETILVRCNLDFPLHLPEERRRLADATCGTVRLTRVYRLNQRFVPESLPGQLAPAAVLPVGELRPAFQRLR